MFYTRENIFIPQLKVGLLTQFIAAVRKIRSLGDASYITRLLR